MWGLQPPHWYRRPPTIPDSHTAFVLGSEVRRGRIPASTEGREGSEPSVEPSRALSFGTQTALVRPRVRGPPSGAAVLRVFPDSGWSISPRRHRGALTPCRGRGPSRRPGQAAALPAPPALSRTRTAASWAAYRLLNDSPEAATLSDERQARQRQDPPASW